MDRREITLFGVAAGVLGASVLATRSQTIAAKASRGLLVLITWKGGVHSYAMADGSDLGNFTGPGFVQRNIRCTGDIPALTLFFRPDVSGARKEVVFELGKFDPKNDPDGSKAGAYNLEPNENGIAYHVEIHDGDALLAHGDVPVHWWASRWRWQSAPRPIVNSPQKLIAAKLLPPYDKRTPTPVQTSDFSRYAYAKPMDNAGVTEAMGGTGDRADIGFIPEPAANWLLNPDDPYAKQAMLAWGETSGTVPWNFRDENTHAPLNLVQYPKANIYPHGDQLQGLPHLATTVSKFQIDNAHFPALSYVPFLATGDPYFLEATQFETLGSFLVTAYYSTPQEPRVDIGQTRGVAWMLRSLFMAGAAAKFAEKAGPLPSWLQPSRTYDTIAAAQLRWLTPWMNNDTEAGTVFAAMPRLGNIEPWQDDFLAFVYGFAVLVGRNDWEPIFRWKLKSTLARTNGKSGWPRAYCSPYWLNLGSNWDDTGSGAPGRAALEAAHPGAKYYPDWGAAWKGFSGAVIAAKDGTLTQAEADHLAADPDNGGRWAQHNGGDFLLYTRGVLATAVTLGVQEAVEPLAFVDRLVASIHYITARWAIVPNAK